MRSRRNKIKKRKTPKVNTPMNYIKGVSNWTPAPLNPNRGLFADKSLIGTREAVSICKAYGLKSMTIDSFYSFVNRHGLIDTSESKRTLRIDRMRLVLLLEVLQRESNKK